MNRHHTDDDEDLEVQLPFTGPRFLNPVVWWRRFLTPLGLSVAVIACGLFLLATQYLCVVAFGWYRPMGVRVACGALIMGPLFLVPNISPLTPQRPLWGRVVFLTLLLLAATVGTTPIFRFFDTLLVHG